MSSEKEATRQRLMNKTKSVGSVNQSEDAIWGFKKRGPKYPGLKEIKRSNSLYERVLANHLYKLREITFDRTSRGTG